MTDASVDAELKEVEMKTEDHAEDDATLADSHPLFDEAVSEEDIRPEQAIVKFKQVIDERTQPSHRPTLQARVCLSHLDRLPLRSSLTPPPL